MLQCFKPGIYYCIGENNSRWKYLRSSHICEFKKPWISIYQSEKCICMILLWLRSANYKTRDCVWIRKIAKLQPVKSIPYAVCLSSLAILNSFSVIWRQSVIMKEERTQTHWVATTNLPQVNWQTFSYGHIVRHIGTSRIGTDAGRRERPRGMRPMALPLSWPQRPLSPTVHSISITEKIKYVTKLCTNNICLRKPITMLGNKIALLSARTNIDILHI
jgi:hypothetical protein